MKTNKNLESTSFFSLKKLFGRWHGILVFKWNFWRVLAQSAYNLFDMVVQASCFQEGWKYLLHMCYHLWTLPGWTSFYQPFLHIPEVSARYLNEAARPNGPPGTHSTVSFNSLSFSSLSFSLQKLYLLPNYFRCPITCHSLSSDAINPESPLVYAEGPGCSARGRREKARRWEERKRGGRRTRNWRISLSW